MAQILRALNSPVRLELLQELRRPQALGDIQLEPARRGGRAGRAMSRVAVRQHLDRLLEMGVVQVRPSVRDGRVIDHYLVDHRQLFALTEELRQLARIRSHGQELLGETRPAAASPQGSGRGPRLILVNGVREGQAFPLRTPGPDGAWTVGRGTQANVLLDYDPYVSLENTRIMRRRGRFWVEALPSSRNGTTLNWEPLTPSEPHPLSNGDAVGVGRSMLLFRSR